MALVISGERSGVGKTTVTLALLAALSKRRQQVQSFKVGPDYIDPMFHSHITGRPCRNLDPYLTSPDYVRQTFHHHSQTAPYSLIEGVMGLFDGAVDPPGFGSTADIAKLLNLPVLLILNCASLSQSIAALAHGYSQLDPDLHIAGLVLNRVGSDRHLQMLTEALAPLNLPILGVLRRTDGISLPDRHLGLVPAGELPHLRETLDKLADLGNRCFDWDRLLPLLETPVQTTTPLFPAATPKLSIAIAQDPAFNFYYADNLDLLRSLGAELIPWSPLRDRQIPLAAKGLYLGGGFPEMFAEALAENYGARSSVAEWIRARKPLYAECGGLMYLTESITTFEGATYAMVGSLPTHTLMGKGLSLGYRTTTARETTVLVQQGETLRGHEFHRSHLSQNSTSPIYHLNNSPEGWSLPGLHASYLHMHWGSRPDLPNRFIQACLDYQPI
jgi:cobyrinic acid a,c-diamide synthase